MFKEVNSKEKEKRKFIFYDLDFTNIFLTFSLANKFTSGKNMIMKNLRGLEQRLMQDVKPELLDVKSKHSENNQPTSPSSYSGMNVLFLHLLSVVILFRYYLL